MTTTHDPLRLDEARDARDEAVEAWRAFLEAWGSGELDSPAKAIPYIQRGRDAVRKADEQRR